MRFAAGVRPASADEARTVSQAFETGAESSASPAVSAMRNSAFVATGFAYHGTT